MKLKCDTCKYFVCETGKLSRCKVWQQFFKNGYEAQAWSNKHCKGMKGWWKTFKEKHRGELG